MAASTRETTMTEYEFELSFALPDDKAPEEHLAALFEAGCDDAVVGTGTPGTIGLAFTREADSAAEAVRSAIANVQQAIPNAELVEAKPDLVTATDIAEISGCSRQNVRQLFMQLKLPTPVFTGRKITVYRLSEIARFEQMKIPGRVAEVAQITSLFNLECQRRRLQHSRTASTRAQ